MQRGTVETEADVRKASLRAVDPIRSSILTAAAVGGLAVTTIFLLLHRYGPGEPPAPRPEWGTVRASTTGVMVLILAGLTAWGVTAFHRCSDAVIRRYLVMANVLSVGWMLVVLLRYATVSPLLTEVFWYLYYLPILFLPLLALFGVLRAATIDRHPVVRRAKRVATGVSATLFVMTLTNGLHFGVFVFEPPETSVYSYGLGYWTIMVWVLALFAVAGAVLFNSSREQLRVATWLLLVLIVVGIVYSLLYIARVQWVFNSNRALTYVAIYVAATEVSLRLGLLPSYSWDREAFATLPLDLWVLTSKRRQVYATHQAGQLSSVAADAVAVASVPEYGAASFSVAGEPDLRYRAYTLRGSIGVLRADVSGVEAQRRLLEARRRQLQRRNLLLEQDHRIQIRLHRLAYERRLLDEVEASLSATAGEIRRLLSDLPSGDTPDAVAVRRRHLTAIKLLVAYSKVKGGLVVAELDGTPFDAERLRLTFAQAAADLTTAGIACAATLDLSGALPSATVNALYDFFFDIALPAFFCTEPVLLLHLSDRGPETAVLRVAHECADEVSCGVAEHEPSEELREMLASHDVQCAFTGSPGALTMRAVAFIGGGG